MKIGLIIPPTFSITTSPPIGIGYIASILLKEGHKVEIHDFVKSKTSIEYSVKTIKEKKFDLLGISVFTARYLSAKEFIRKFKKNEPNIPIVVGGVHISALPEESIQDLNADFAIIGEGEYSLLELVKEIEKGTNKFNDIKGLVYKTNGKIKINKKREPISNLNEIPFPAWNLMPPDSYPHNPCQIFYKKFPIAIIISSRGCPNNCYFCAAQASMEKILRKRCATNFVDEIEYLIKKFNVKELHIADDNINFSKEHASSICEEMIKRKIKIQWKTPSGINIENIDDKLIKIMKESGCYEVSFGIETGSQKIADNIEKRLDLKSCYEKIKKFKKHGIDTCGFFMVGLKNDTLDTVKETIRYAKNSPLDLAHFAICIPYPGSKLFKEWSKRQGQIEWNKFYNFQPFEGISKLSPEELKKILKFALISFYLKPYRIIKVFQKSKIKQFPYLFKLGFSYLFCKIK